MFGGEQARPHRSHGVEELASRGSRTPHDEFRVTAALRVVRAANECGDYVTAVFAEVIVRAECICRKASDEAAAVLSAIGIAQLPAGELCSAVRLARRLHRSGTQVLPPSSAAGRALGTRRTGEVHEFRDPEPVRGVQYCKRAEQVVAHQFDWLRAIQFDPTGQPGAVEYDLGPGRHEERFDCRGFRQVRFPSSAPTSRVTFGSQKLY